MSAVWRWAMAEEKIPEAGDPWLKALQGVTVQPGDVQRRLPFEDSEIALILEQARSLPTEAERWSWPLMLFTGARPEEVACIRVQDLVMREGTRCIEIRHEAQANRRLKNASSERLIPVSDALMATGFWDWATAQKGHENGWLLDLTFTELSRRSNGLQQFNGASLRRWGIRDERKPVYSCRHTFNYKCVRAELPDRLTMALMGHSDTRSMTARYSGSYSVQQLHEGINRLQWPQGH